VLVAVVAIALGVDTGFLTNIVTIDGKALGDTRGMDTDADGNGEVTTQRLCQLVRANGAVADHTFEIHFLDPGVQAYVFTFG
jgi:Thioredoxin like C-terminal domain